MAEIPLHDKTGRRVATALLDDADAARLGRWSWTLMRSHGYARRSRYRGRVNGKAKLEMVLMHREVMGAVSGDGLVVRHRNGNLLDNRKENLFVLSGVTRARAFAGVEG
jgi:hypothetical protein